MSDEPEIPPPFDADDEGPQEGDHLIVNRAVFLSAIKAMSALMEQTAEYFQHIKSADGISRETKQVSMQILSENIKALQMISQGFESSMYESIPQENKHLN